MQLLRICSNVVFFLVFARLACVAQPVSEPGARELIARMVDTIYSLESVYFEYKAKERIGESYSHSHSIVKNQLEPYKMYLRKIETDGSRGPEVLYIPGWNDGDALVSPNKFPYFNVDLDPMSWIMRRNNHHTVKRSSFNYVARILKHALERADIDGCSKWVREPDEKFRNWDCYKIRIPCPNYQLINYTVKSGETLTSIAHKLYLSDFHLLEVNDKDDFDEVEPGETIKVPNRYAREVVIMIDKKSMMPVFKQIVDDKGVFAEYRYIWIKKNVQFTDEDFSPGNEDYNF